MHAYLFNMYLKRAWKRRGYQRGGKVTRVRQHEQAFRKSHVRLLQRIGKAKKHDGVSLENIPFHARVKLSGRSILVLGCAVL